MAGGGDGGRVLGGGGGTWCAPRGGGGPINVDGLLFSTGCPVCEAPGGQPLLVLRLPALQGAA